MKKHRTLLLSFCNGAILFLLLFAIGVLWFGGIGPLIAYVNGEAVYLSPRLADLGSHDAGIETTAVFKMVNLSAKEISIIGEHSTCGSCTFSEQIPVVAAPGKTVAVKVNVHLPKYDSNYDQTITFMVAEPNRLAMHPVRIKASIPQPLTRPVEEESESVSLTTKLPEEQTPNE